MATPRAHRRTLTRRTLLHDLGRVTLGAVVIGTLGACDDGGAEPEAGDTPAPSSATSSTTGEAPTTGDPTASGDLAWERASFGFVSAYVLVRSGEALVFDTGTSDGGVDPITAALEAAGVGWGDVSHVLVSHDHGDHIGGIEAVMAEATEATAHASGPDFMTLQSRVDGAQEVADSDQVLGLRVVATPGHTLGHVSAFEPDAGLLLAGDAIVNGVQVGGTTGNGIEVSPPDFTADGEQAAASAAALADLAPTAILFGHGEPVTADAAAQLADFATG